MSRNSPSSSSSAAEDMFIARCVATIVRLSFTRRLELDKVAVICWSLSGRDVLWSFCVCYAVAPAGVSCAYDSQMTLPVVCAITVPPPAIDAPLFVLY